MKLRALFLYLLVFPAAAAEPDTPEQKIERLTKLNADLQKQLAAAREMVAYQAARAQAAESAYQAETILHRMDRGCGTGKHAEFVSGGLIECRDDVKGQEK